MSEFGPVTFPAYEGASAGVRTAAEHEAEVCRRSRTWYIVNRSWGPAERAPATCPGDERAGVEARR